jgi:hypothetical protein
LDGAFCLPLLEVLDDTFPRGGSAARLSLALLLNLTTLDNLTLGLGLALRVFAFLALGLAALGLAGLGLAVLSVTFLVTADFLDFAAGAGLVRFAAAVRAQANLLSLSALVICSQRQEDFLKRF